MSTPPSGSEHAATQSGGFRHVLAEIDAEVARRRENGEFPDELLADLDAELLRHAPVTYRTSDLEGAVRAIEAASFIDIDPPVESSRFAFRYVKIAIKRLLGWYQLHITRQVMILGLNAARPIRVLARRLQELDERVTRLEDTGGPDPGATRSLAPRTVLSSDAAALVAPHLGTTARRVLVGHDDGTLADALRAVGFDAYACAPGADELSPDDRRGDDVSEHLDGLQPRTLGAVVLVHQEGVRTPSGARRLCGLAVSRIVRNGSVVVLAADPDTWKQAAGPVAADLAAGPALHPETWAHLLAAGGATVESLDAGTPTAVIVARRRT